MAPEAPPLTGRAPLRWGGPRRRHLPGLLLAGLAPLAPFAPAGARDQGPPQVLPITARWCLAPQRCIELEVADTPRRQALGLQLRPALPPLRGMWFPYDPPAVARFWMHRTPEPLDMLFVRDGRVLAIETNALPCLRLPCPSYGPDQPVEGVLELAAGEAARLGITAGTPVSIEPLDSAAFNDGHPPAPAPD
ncbi:MAG: DUF192 domain-containing protein [Synechococcaceae cyanobacterium]